MTTDADRQQARSLRIKLSGLGWMGNHHACPNIHAETETVFAAAIAAARAEGWRAALNAVCKWYRKEGFADSRDDTDAVRSTMRTIRALKEPGHGK